MVLKDLCVFVFLQREKTPIWGKNQRKHPASVIFVDMQWWLKTQISYLKEQRFHNVSIKGNRSSASNLNILPRINQNDVNEPSFQDLADNVHIYFHVLCWYDKQLLVETYISSNLPTEGKHQAAVPGPRSLKGQESPKNNQLGGFRRSSCRVAQARLSAALLTINLIYFVATWLMTFLLWLFGRQL